MGAVRIAGLPRSIGSVPGSPYLTRGPSLNAGELRMVSLRQESLGKEDETRVYGIFKVQLEESNRPGSGAVLQQRSQWRRLRLNLQPRGSQAKAYQVKQVRGVILTHRLAREPNDELPADESSLEEPGSSLAEGTTD
jgi:hypothetical protein